MRLSTFVLCATALALMAGCNKPAAKKTESDAPAVQVDAPGVKVDIEPGKGTEVKAPGVDVETSPGGPAKVEVDGEVPK
jgi:hypothetical protein